MLRAASRRIHPTAVLEAGCKLGEGVRVGPFCVVGRDVTLGDGVTLESHVNVSGHTTVGKGSLVHSFAALGAAPFDFKYEGEPTVLRLGANCRIGEYAHLSGGTAAGGGLTSIGDRCLIMSHCHVAHDCALGDGVLLASSAALAGHVHVGDGARISGYACVHQKVSVGRGAFLGGGAVLADDLVPFGLAVGNRAQLHGLNLRGLRRGGTPGAELRALLSAFRYLFELRETDGLYPPLPLPPLPTLRERAAACAAAYDATRHPRLAEMVRFVLGRRQIAAPAAAGAVAPLEGEGAAHHRALCQPPRERTGTRVQSTDSLRATERL